MTAPKSDLTYNTDDDGVWVHCRACLQSGVSPWGHAGMNLGHEGTVEDAVLAWDAHLKEHHPEEQAISVVRYAREEAHGTAPVAEGDPPEA